MTSTATHGVEWVRQGRDLWTGRLDGRPIGTVERGRRFTFVDTEGRARAACPTLAAAQHGHLAPVARAASARPAARFVRTMLSSSAASAAVMSAALLVSGVLVR